MLAVIDYEAGNLHSLNKALEALGVAPVVTADPRVLDRADAVILPGVGSAVAAMRELRARGLVEPLRDLARSGRPFLGVCLGLQVLLESSEEGIDGDEPCLGVLEGRVRLLPPGLKVPHMGWNSVEVNTSCPLFQGIPQDSYFYFVHSYYADVRDTAAVAGWTDYGVRFPVAVWQGGLMATQFHPEKSGRWGLAVLRNFLTFAGLAVAEPQAHGEGVRVSA
ncbi:MAG: imidazole glycerol phosphate synthase subunit HisH [Chloroflexota bacterium]